jgi:hypothetical protein
MMALISKREMPSHTCTVIPENAVIQQLISLTCFLGDLGVLGGSM